MRGLDTVYDLCRVTVARVVALLVFGYFAGLGAGAGLAQACVRIGATRFIVCGDGLYCWLFCARCFFGMVARLSI